jgi:hypothetical protein
MSRQAQRTFMNNGGIYAGILQDKYDKGELVPPENYAFAEYPKMLHMHKGVRQVHRSAQDIRDRREAVTIEWDEEQEIYEDVIVHSEEEEDRVLNGGKSTAQQEEERVAALAQCKQRGIPADPSWPLLRLQRELGAAPSHEAVEALQARVAQLETEAALKQRIAELEAQIAGKPLVANEAEQLRSELRAAGVAVDGRWSIGRLREELERVTEPERNAA